MIMLRKKEDIRLALPREYQYLADEKHPRLLVEALKYYGVREVAGSGNNPIILDWAKDVGGWIGEYYTKDETPWCGLFVAKVCKDAGLPYNQRALTALSWAGWGVKTSIPMLGDVLTFTRPGGGHVGFYVGEDIKHYHVYGGNQQDCVGITKIEKRRLYEARRTKWRWRQPDNIRRVWMDMSDRNISFNEV